MLRSAATAPYTALKRALSASFRPAILNRFISTAPIASHLLSLRYQTPRILFSSPQFGRASLRGLATDAVTTTDEDEDWSDVDDDISDMAKDFSEEDDFDDEDEDEDD